MASVRPSATIFKDFLRNRSSNQGKGVKFCINGLGHMTKMTSSPIYCKNIEYILLQNHKSYDLETQGLKPYKVYIIDDPRITVTYFTTR